MIPFSWTRVSEGWAREQCPPDFTPNNLRGTRWVSICSAAHNAGYVCTRRLDHGGRHAAGDGSNIVAVWP